MYTSCNVAALATSFFFELHIKFFMWLRKLHCGYLVTLYFLYQTSKRSQNTKVRWKEALKFALVAFWWFLLSHKL